METGFATSASFTTLFTEGATSALPGPGTTLAGDDDCCLAIGSETVPGALICCTGEGCGVCFCGMCANTGGTADKTGLTEPLADTEESTCNRDGTADSEGRAISLAGAGTAERVGLAAPPSNCGTADIVGCFRVWS